MAWAAASEYFDKEIGESDKIEVSNAYCDGVFIEVMSEERREDEITLYLKRSEKGSCALTMRALNIQESRICKKTRVSF